MLKDAVAVFARPPLGVGVAAFATLRSLLFGRRQDTHNLDLAVARALGCQGPRAPLACVAVVTRTLVRIRNQAQWYLDTLERAPQASDVPPVANRSTAEDLRLIHATATAAGGYILLRLVLGLFGMDLYEIYWWIGLGLCVALGRL